MKNFIKVAGVTFKNEDGVSRQNIIRSLSCNHGIITVDLCETVFHNNETNEDERAIKVLEHNTKQCIGWIPRTDLDNENLSDQMTGFVRNYKGVWSVQLDNIKRPSAKQYAYAKSIANKKHIAMPAYDVRAYAYLYEAVR